MNQFLQFLDKGKIVTGIAPKALAADGDFVSMKGYQKLTVVICIDNATTVTATAITLDQASAVAGTGAKALAFSKMYANTDTAASDTLVETTVTSNTFDTDDTDAKNLLYVIEIDATDLDMDNNFDCVRVGCASGANSVGCVLYLLHGPRYADTLSTSAITD